jgi:hypothetical protein
MIASEKRWRSAAAALATAVVMLCASAAGALTVVPGGVVDNEVWTAAGSPYVVYGDVQIPAGSMLKMEAGTQVQMAPPGQPSSLGAGFLISGAIVIDGSPTNPVVIGPAVENQREIKWSGLSFQTGAIGSRIQYARLIEPNIGLEFGTVADGNMFLRIEIVRPNTGVSLFDGTLTMDGVIIDGGDNTAYGIKSASWRARVVLMNCVIARPVRQGSGYTNLALLCPKICERSPGVIYVRNARHAHGRRRAASAG